MAEILLIEDMLGVRRAIGAMLKRAGHTVTVAETGGQAVSLLKQRRIDVVVTDMLMPDIDGFDILFQVKEMSKWPPVIAISGGGRRRVGGNGAAHRADQRRCLPREAVRRICSSSSTSCSARRRDIGDPATERRRTRSRPHRASSPISARKRRRAKCRAKRRSRRPWRLSEPCATATTIISGSMISMRK